MGHVDLSTMLELIGPAAITRQQALRKSDAESILRGARVVALSMRLCMQD